MLVTRSSASHSGPTRKMDDSQHIAGLTPYADLEQVLLCPSDRYENHRAAELNITTSMQEPVSRTGNAQLEKHKGAYKAAATDNGEVLLLEGHNRVWNMTNAQQAYMRIWDTMCPPLWCTCGRELRTHQLHPAQFCHCLGTQMIKDPRGTLHVCECSEEASYKGGRHDTLTIYGRRQRLAWPLHAAEAQRHAMTADGLLVCTDSCAMALDGSS
jgi:hypothetical protein